MGKPCGKAARGPAAQDHGARPQPRHPREGPPHVLHLARLVGRGPRELDLGGDEQVGHGHRRSVRLQPGPKLLEGAVREGRDLGGAELGVVEAGRANGVQLVEAGAVADLGYAGLGRGRIDREKDRGKDGQEALHSRSVLLTNASRRLSGDHEGTLIVPWPP